MPTNKKREMALLLVLNSQKQIVLWLIQEKNNI